MQLGGRASERAARGRISRGGGERAARARVAAGVGETVSVIKKSIRAGKKEREKKRAEGWL